MEALKLMVVKQEPIKTRRQKRLVKIVRKDGRTKNQRKFSAPRALQGSIKAAWLKQLAIFVLRAGTMQTLVDQIATHVPVAE
jgi:hypothetical protein